ncbi:MAG: M13 family metallopeptidase N-terminal domain-containing protein, partial [Peptostreptococcaceae bacterium]|nr:M13 family metallopeptidase N-terminal domain-containing protein [Peptostreptococcaceae bacterium]
MRNWKKILLSASMAALMSITSIASYASPITNPGRSMKPESAKTTSSVPNQVSEQATARSDFYEYINAQWLKDAKIPEDRASISNFTIANDQVEASIKKMIADLNKNYDQLAEGSDEKKLVDFYNVALDFKTRDALGFKPVKPYTDRVNAVKSIDGFTTLASELFMKGYITAAVASPSIDRKDSQMTVLYIGAPSTGLSKTTIESKDEFSVKRQNAYKTLLTELFELNGNSK